MYLQLRVYEFGPAVRFRWNLMVLSSLYKMQILSNAHGEAKTPAWIGRETHLPLLAHIAHLVIQPLLLIRILLPFLVVRFIV